MKFFFIVFSVTAILFFFGSKVIYANEANACGFANADDKQWSRCCTAVAVETVRQSMQQQKSFLIKLKDKFLDVTWCKFFSCTNEDEEKKILEVVQSSDNFQSIIPCEIGSPSTSIFFDKACICVQSKEMQKTSFLCDRYLAKDVKNFNKTDYNSCIQCFIAKGFWTGLGCFYVGSWKDFFEKNVFGFLIGLAGLIAFFCIIYSAFLMQTSSGNPEKVKNAQAMLTSCIMGLILIIFSVVILKIIGVDILKIPGFQ